MFKGLHLSTLPPAVCRHSLPPRPPRADAAQDENVRAPNLVLRHGGWGGGGAGEGCEMIHEWSIGVKVGSQ